MRHLANLEREPLALRFHDYMLARGMPTKVEREGDEWAVWIVEEDHVEKAREELEAFLANPDDPRYVEAAKAAETVRRDVEEKRKQHQRNTRRVTREWDDRRNRGAVVTFWLLLGSVVLCLTSVDWRHPFEHDGGRRGFVALGTFQLKPTTALRGAFIQEPTARGKIGWYPTPTLWDHLQQGQIWRLFTPMFIHFTPLHIVFNMMWLQRLGWQLEMRRGPWKFLGIVLLISGASNVAQLLVSGPAFGGMSGVVFGLFGYIWMRTLYDPADNLYIDANNTFLMIAWLLICTTGAVGPIANVAHFVGLGTGCLLGMLPIWMGRHGRR